MSIRMRGMAWSKKPIVILEYKENRERWLCPVCNVSYNPKETNVLRCSKCRTFSVVSDAHVNLETIASTMNLVIK